MTLTHNYHLGWSLTPHQNIGPAPNSHSKETVTDGMTMAIYPCSIRSASWGVAWAEPITTSKPLALPHSQNIIDRWHMELEMLLLSSSLL